MSTAKRQRSALSSPIAPPTPEQTTAAPAAPTPAVEDTQPAPQQAAESTTKPAAGRKRNASVYLSPSDYQRASLAMQLYGRREGYRGLSDLGARLIMAEVERIEAAHNGGRRLDEHNPLDHI